MSIIGKGFESLSAWTAAVLVLCVAVSPVRSQPVESNTALSIIGTWRALAPEDAPRSSGLLELRISATEDGGLRVLALDQMRFPFGPTTVSLQRDADRYQATFEYFMPEGVGFTSGPVRLTAELAPPGDRLAVRFADDKRHWDLIYRRSDDPSFKKYDTPRLNAAGQAVSHYRYRVPAASVMPTADAASVGVRAEALERMVQDVLERKQLYRDSLLVLKDGKLILEEYFYGFERERLHTIMSITKSTTGLIIGAHAAEGKFDIKRPVIELFPEYPDSPWRRPDRRISIEQLMRMANVLGWGDDTGFDVSAGYNYARLGRQAPFAQGLFTRDLPGWLFAQTPFPDSPNSFYLYNTMYTQLSSTAFMRATGVKLRDEIAKRLIEPLGERDWDYFAFPGDAAPSYADSQPASGSGLMLRPLALAKYGLMVSQCGRWRGHQLFPAAWIATATTLRSIAPDRNHSGYGYNWALDKIVSLPDGRTHWLIGHGGAGGQSLYIVPDYGLVFATTAFDFEGESEQDEQDLLLNHLLPAVAAPGTTFVRDDILPQDLHAATLSRCAEPANSPSSRPDAATVRRTR